MVKFGDWCGDFHADYEQVKRIESGRKLAKKFSEFNCDAETGELLCATMQGTAPEPYVVTLNECTCTDYSIRRLPCKHIYAAAFRLGLMDGLPEYKKKDAAFNPRRDIERYKQLYMDGQMSADAYVKICTALGKLKK